MTRINTNVQSLVGRNNLARANGSLEQSLTRLSTGLRINTGKDDPAGLIASENLRSDITAVRKSVGNTERANQVIATADSALGQVSSLLNDIRGLVTESANAGALSDDAIAANQAQIDSSLEALNRIAQTTTFQGRKLLDGGLNFTTSASTNFSRLTDLQIDQANLGATGSVSVDVVVSTAATKAQVDITGIASATVAANSTTNISLTNAAAQASGTVTLNTTNNATFVLTATSGGLAAGVEGNGVKTLSIVDGASEGAVYDATANSLTVTVDITGGNNTVADLASVISAGTDFTLSGTTNGTDTIAATNTGSGTFTGGRNADTTVLKVTADASGIATNGVTVTLSETSSGSANTATASIVSGNIQVAINGTVAKSDIISAIHGLTGYSAELVSSTNTAGSNSYVAASDTPPGVATLAGGAAASGGLAQDAVFQLNGLTGSEVFDFKAGTSISQLRDAINLVKDATGVEATINGTTTTTLELKSTTYGSASFVNFALISETTGGTIRAAIGSGARDTGTDVIATVNGISAKGKGNELSINTATLDLKATVEAAFTGTVEFDVTGGGALFQLGPDVVSNQQARIGITGVNTGQLGGVAGKLYQLASGGTADLDSNPNLAADIVGEAINQVTSLRGRLGSFQRTTLETNKNALGDTLVNLQDAESLIRDADFAEETASLTRAQILVQSGTQVLSIANQNPQNVLSLLR